MLRSAARLAIAALMAVTAAATAQERMQSCYFQSDGLRIHSIDAGVGEPVLLIHGFGTSIETCWIETGIVRALLDSGYRVIACDIRGHGQSEKPHDPARYGPAGVGDAIRLLDELEIGRAHVVGYSMGGRLANAIRARYPDRVLSVTLGGFGEDGRQPNSDDTAQRLEAAAALERGDVGPFLRIHHRGEFPQEKIKAMSRWLAAHNDLQALAATMRGEPFPAIPLSNLRTNRIPTLAIVGERDANRQRVDSMKREMSHLEVIVLPGDDHLTTLLDRRFTEELLKFLAKQ